MRNTKNILIVVGVISILPDLIGYGLWHHYVTQTLGNEYIQCTEIASNLPKTIDYQLDSQIGSAIDSNNISTNNTAVSQMQNIENELDKQAGTACNTFTHYKK